MGRCAVHPWKRYLTREESARISKIDLQSKELSAKIRELKAERNRIRMRASKRAVRG